ncbi:hypothetical protein NX059_010681 [Plenodomus lindquistii]|nr:hypothetical protein NX059_010681 [Plenodomus lindquistii]
MAPIDTQCRVAIRVKVTDIGGSPLSRHVTLGQAFCSSVLSRDFRNRIDTNGYDACHVPSNFDSTKGVYAIFLFDIGVKGQADLSLIPHFFYFNYHAESHDPPR